MIPRARNTAAPEGATREGLVSVRYTGKNGAGYVMHQGKSWRIEKGRSVAVPEDLARVLIADGDYARDNHKEGV